MASIFIDFGDVAGLVCCDGAKDGCVVVVASFTGKATGCGVGAIWMAVSDSSNGKTQITTMVTSMAMKAAWIRRDVGMVCCKSFMVFPLWRRC